MSGERRPRILVLCPYPQGVAAGQRFKYEQYLDDWRLHGWDITVSSYMDLAMWSVVHRRGHLIAKLWGAIKGHCRRLLDVTRLGHYDVVYVFMWVTPVGSTVFERLVRRRARALVYDLEDNLFVERRGGEAEHPNSLLRFLPRAAKPRVLARCADVVIIASADLTSPCRALNPRARIVCIPPSLDIDRLRPRPDNGVDAARVVIGWTGTFSSRPYLDLLRGVFRTLATRVPFTLRVIGNFDYALPGVALEVVRWSAEREAHDLQAIDIGVYPLPDDEWTRGKAGLKIMQYQAIGVPCVASDVPLSRSQIRDGETGFLAADADQWIARLEQLVRDADLRRRMGSAARRDAVARYSREATAPVYRELLADLARGGGLLPIERRQA